MMDPPAGRRLLPVTTASEDARRQFEAGRHAAFHYQPTQAREYLDAAIAADPAFVLAYLHRGGMSLPSERGAYFHLARANRDRVTEDEGRMVDAFHAFLWDGKTEDAVVIFSDLADRYDDDPYLPTYLGLRYLRNLGDLDRAKEQFERAARRDPSFSQAHHWLGQVALEQGEYEAAAEALMRYARMAPDQPRPYDSLGIFYLRQGQLDEAEEQFEAALERDRGFANSRENLSRVQVERSRRRLEDAVRSRDIDAIMKLFTGAAQVALPGASVLAGSAAIASYWEGTFSGDGVDMHTVELHLGIEGDVATEVGHYRSVAGADETIDSGQYLTVWALTVEGWKIHRSMWTSDRYEDDPKPDLA